MIPRQFHQLWIRPSIATTGIPDDVLQNFQAWRTMHRTHVQRLWSLPEVTALCYKQNRPEVAGAIEACRFPSMQADIARLLLLEAFGGYWIDLKLYPLRSFLDDLTGNDLVLTEHFAKPDLPDPSAYLSNSFIGAVPAHPVISRVLKAVCENVNRRMGGSIYGVTGATNLMAAVEGVESYTRLGFRDAWGGLFEIRGGSYNGPDMHWSVREGLESPYVE